MTITDEMIACAENGLGEDRYNEIIHGTAPNPLETLKLLGCIKK